MARTGIPWIAVRTANEVISNRSPCFIALFSTLLEGDTGSRIGVFSCVYDWVNLSGMTVLEGNRQGRGFHFNGIAALVPRPR